jgi:hypothetical protein
MSLQLAANHLAAQGRGPDKNLVHMSPREVAGLQALAMAGGGSLSINPQTGLPEAGFLDKMLPMLIGVGITAATGGAAAGVAPWMVGLGLGGLETARTGSLQKGLMAGLGAYGGAGLGAGLMGAGAGAAGAAGAGPNAAVLDAGLAGSGAPATGMASIGQNVGANAAQMGQGIGALGTGAGNAGFMTGVGGTKGLLMSGAAGLAPALLDQEEFTPPASDSEQYKYKFHRGRVQDPEAGYEGPVSGERNFFAPRFERLADGGPVEQMSEDNIFDMQNARGGVSDMGIDNATGMERMAEGGATDEDKYSGNAYAFAPIARSAPAANRAMPAPPAAQPDTGVKSAYTYDPVTKSFKSTGFDPSAAASGDPYASDPYAGVSYGFAGGGITDLGGYSDGGRLLRGPGDGVSDSIPAMIGQKQPARLADGEFVVPARIVSELGNGSTEAGARKLYAMMDRVQRARGKTTGKGKVAKNSRADKFLPA